MNRQGYTGLDSDRPESANSRLRPIAGAITEINATAGYGAQAHIFAIGMGIEGGGTIDSNGVGCGYVKVCGSVGPGLFFGGGPTAGGGTGSLSAGWQPSTSGFIAAGSWFGGVGASGDFNSSGTSGSGSVRTRIDIRGGWGAVVGATGCRQVNFSCSAPPKP